MRSINPPFLLTLEIFNNNVHNCMVDFGTSSNFMPFSMCQILNIDPKKSNIQIVQLDISKVRLLGQMKNVLIRLSVDSCVHQTIDILVADIPKAYGLMLSRDWSSQLNGYFAIDWSHLWLPYNGKPNQSRVDRERYMKHVVTELEAPNEPIMFINTILGNYCFDTFFRDFPAEESPVPENVVSKLMFCDHQLAPRDDEKASMVSQNQKKEDFWTLYFDGSKTKEGVGVGCVLTDPKKNKTSIACSIEFECTNNVAEYEALIQGLKKAIDLGVKDLKVYGDSKIIMKQIRNLIHCISNRLTRYQQEVWDLMPAFSSFNICSIPRYLNVDVDLLANVASHLIPSENFEPNAFSAELIYRTSVLDNVTNWRVFNDDEQIINFLTMEDTFKDSVIDEEKHDAEIKGESGEPPNTF